MPEEANSSLDDVGAQDEPSLPVAGFGVRLIAYLFDVLPITLVVAAVFYFFLGFDDTLHRYTNSGTDDIEARTQFLSQRNRIRDVSFVVYILYCAVCEGSALQGTVGKYLLGLRVTDIQGQRLSVGRSFGRNFAKILSYLPCALGFLWVLWAKDKQGWHDMLARTLVKTTR